MRILDPKCVAKTFPDYFETLLSVCRAPTSQVPVLCIDGPTASGKGTVAAAVARALGYHFLDSGAMYRITAYAALRAGHAIGPESEAAIAAFTADDDRCPAALGERLREREQPTLVARHAIRCRYLRDIDARHVERRQQLVAVVEEQVEMRIVLGADVDHFPLHRAAKG